MIKDSADNYAVVTGHAGCQIEIQACDVDGSGNVENVDIIVEHQLLCCFNINNAEQCKSAVETLLRELWQVTS